MKEYCPRCGAERVGAFRFCRSCRLDFDTLASAPTVPPTTLRVAEPIESVAIGPGRSGGRFSRRTVLGAGLAIVVGLAAVGSLQRPESGAPTTGLATASPAARAVATATATPRVTQPPTPRPSFAPTGQTTEATVVRVVDGDTIVVAYGGQEYSVRYIGMDSPETVDPNTTVQWMGPQATAANAALVEGKTVILEKDVSEVDQYDRLLRYVWLTDGAAWTLVNLELVHRGVAFAKSYPPDVKYDAIYARAEEVARSQAVGLWHATPAPPSPTAAPPAPVFLVPPAPESDCHPSYDPCLPIVGDMDCKDVRAMGKDPVRVKGSDPYRLDGSDNDGIGCE